MMVIVRKTMIDTIAIVRSRRLDLSLKSDLEPGGGLCRGTVQGSIGWMVEFMMEVRCGKVPTTSE